VNKRRLLFPPAAFLLVLALWLFFNLMAHPVSAALLEETPVTISKRVLSDRTLFFSGDYVEFEITIRNNTTMSLTDITVLDGFDPTEFTFYEDSSIISGTETIPFLPESSVEEGQARLNWAIETLPPEQSLVIRYWVETTFSGKDLITNTASVWMGGKSVSEASVTLATARFEIEHTALGDPLVGPNGRVRFNMTVKNLSNQRIPNVEVLHHLYGNERYPIFTNVTPTGEVATHEDVSYQNYDDLIVWTLGELGPEETRKITYDVIINPFFDEGNEAVFSWASVGVDGYAVQSEDEDLELKPGFPELAITRREVFKLDKQGNIRRLQEGQFYQGDTIRFIIHYENRGNFTAEQVVLEDEFSEALFQLVDDTHILNGGELVGFDIIRWEVESIAAGATGTVSYDMKIRDGLTQLELDEDGVIPVNNIARVMVGVDTMDSLHLDGFAAHIPILRVKQISANEVSPGEKGAVTIEVENIGAVDAENIRVQVIYDSAAGTAEPKNEGHVIADGLIEWQGLTITAGTADTGLPTLLRYDFTVDKDLDTNNVPILVKLFVNDNEVPEAIGPPFTMSIKPKSGSIIDNEKIFAFLISLLIVGTLTVVGYQSHVLTLKNDLQPNQYHFYRDIIEILAVIVIVSAVLMLGFSNDLKQDAALTVLSGIAGYVLGRRSSGTEPQPVHVLPQAESNDAKPGESVAVQPSAISSAPNVARIEEVADRNEEA
jgi:uncharacterized repeat protein (TIGR01451 family)